MPSPSKMKKQRIGDLYTPFIRAFRERFIDSFPSKQERERQGHQKWNELKVTEDAKQEIQVLILKWTTETRLRSEREKLPFYLRSSPGSDEPEIIPVSGQGSDNPKTETSSSVQSGRGRDGRGGNAEAKKSVGQVKQRTPRVYSKPAQEKLFAHITVTTGRLEYLNKITENRPLTDEEQKEWVELHKKNASLVRQIERQKRQAEVAKKSHEKKRRLLEKAAERVLETEDGACSSFIRPSPGRPAFEVINPQLHQAIMDCVGNADAGESLSLDALQVKLREKYDLDIKRSTLYTKLLPRDSTTKEGKRHANAVPVRLINPHKNANHANVDGHFATALVRDGISLMPLSETIMSENIASGEPAENAINAEQDIARDEPVKQALMAEDTWAAVYPGDKFPKGAVRALNRGLNCAAFDAEGRDNGKCDSYVALWVRDDGQCIFGRAWNDNGMARAEFADFEGKTVAAEDTGGYRVLTYVGPVKNHGFRYRWVRARNVNENQLVYAGDCIPIVVVQETNNNWESLGNGCWTKRMAWTCSGAESGQVGCHEGDDFDNSYVLIKEEAVTDD